MKINLWQHCCIRQTFMKLLLFNESRVLYKKEKASHKIPKGNLISDLWKGSGGYKVASDSVSKVFFFFFLNIANKVLFWNYFHLVLTKHMGKVHQLIQGFIMIKTKEINPSLILKYQYKSFFHYCHLMRFSPWIHLKHFSLMKKKLLFWSLYCIWSKIQVLWLHDLCTHQPLHWVLLESLWPLESNHSPFFAQISAEFPPTIQHISKKLVPTNL